MTRLALLLACLALLVPAPALCFNDDPEGGGPCVIYTPLPHWIC